MKSFPPMINLLPPEAKSGWRRGSAFSRSIWLIVSLLCLILTLSLGGSYAWVYHQQLELEQEYYKWAQIMDPENTLAFQDPLSEPIYNILVMDPENTLAFRLEKINDTQNQMNFLLNERKPYLRLLAKAKQEWPDDIIINELSLETDAVHIHGIAQGHRVLADFIKLLNGAAELAQIIQLDSELRPQDGSIHFYLAYSWGKNKEDYHAQ